MSPKTNAQTTYIETKHGKKTMNSKAIQINKMIDDATQSYAYAWCEKPTTPRGGYGHMYMLIFLTGNSAFSRPSGAIKLSSQIGSDFGNEDQFQQLYSQKIGFDGRYGDANLEELEKAVKVLRKIKKHMDKMYEEYGSPSSFAKMCQRALIGAGVKWLLTPQGGCYSGGGSVIHSELTKVSEDSARVLELMENTLVADFSKRIAA